MNAALPWVLMGIALAIISADYQKAKKNKQYRNHVCVGLGLGLIAGVAMNQMAVVDNHIWGLVLGALYGIAGAMMYGTKQ